jgi:hypothetical protein
MKLRADLSGLPASTGLIARALLTVAAAIAAFWILGAFVDALHVSIRQGEALRESQRSGAPIAAVAQR